MSRREHTGCRHLRDCQNTVFIAATSHLTMAAEVRRGQQRAMGLDGKRSRHLLIVHSETTAGVRNLTLAS